MWARWRWGLGAVPRQAPRRAERSTRRTCRLRRSGAAGAHRRRRAAGWSPGDPIHVGADRVGTLHLRITTADGVATVEREITPGPRRIMSVAVLGENLPAGSPVSVNISAPTEGLLLGVDETGRVPLGTIVGGDGMHLVRVGDVMLTERDVAPVRLVDTVHVEADTDEAAAAVAARTAVSAGAVVDRDVGLADGAGSGIGLEVTATHFGKDRVSAAIETDRPALLVASVASYPGWSVRVDGEPAELVQADAAFLGVAVPPGRHRIDFTFRPRHLTLSRNLLIGGFSLFMALIVSGVRRRSPSQ
ncbi:MAG: YfhO family protein [Acidimicrobiales bacterium]